MKLQQIQLKNYRNIATLDCEVSHINILIAPNGSGKTNVLESIYYAIFGSTFRALQSNAELVGPLEQFARIFLTWESSTLECVIAIHEKRITRTFKINGKAAPLHSIPYRFPTVLFAPHSLDLIAGSPQQRREDLDAYLSIIYPQYAHTIKRYTTVLKNKNALLKSIREGHSQQKELTFWNTELSKLGSELYAYRTKYMNAIITNLHETAATLYHDFDNLRLHFKSNVEPAEESYAQTLLQKYEENQQKEIIVGKTLYGVHKDDYDIFFNEMNLRFQGSRGQQRLGSLILKLAQVYFAKQIHDAEFPLFLIDDIFSELDEKHRDNIGNYISNSSMQSILTGAVKLEFPEIILKQGQEIKLT
jgi:DNA replication and repair protein RecF